MSEQQKERDGQAPPEDRATETAEEDPSPLAAQAEALPAESRRMDPAHKVTLVVLAIVVVLFAWHIAADRATPYTDLGKVDGYVVPIASQVSGYVTEVGVELNEIVQEGDTLLRIDPVPFELAVTASRANLDLAGQQLRAQTAAIGSAAGRLGVALAQQDRARRYYDRVETIAAANPGALSQADRDRASTQLASADANLLRAEADLERAEEQVGVTGEANPSIRAAAAALAQAEFDLENTVILAPGYGIVGDLQLAEGHFASAGQPLATFISAQDVWVRADMRENNLGRIKLGDPVEIALDVAPGRVFQGRVASVSAGVNTGQDARGGLPTAEATQGWLQEPQRFPVIVRFEGDEAEGFRRAGGRASVVVYTSSNRFLNGLAWMRIRITTLLSYVR
jgi:multidrug resistance efflux pump